MAGEGVALLINNIILLSCTVSGISSASGVDFHFPAAESEMTRNAGGV